MIKYIIDKHVGVITFESFKGRQFSKKFCCEVHEELWKQEHDDLYELSQIKYVEKYGVDLCTAIQKDKAFSSKINKLLLDNPIVKVPFISVLERQTIVD